MGMCLDNGASRFAKNLGHEDKKKCMGFLMGNPGHLFLLESGLGKEKSYWNTVNYNWGCPQVNIFVQLSWFHVSCAVE